MKNNFRDLSIEELEATCDDKRKTLFETINESKRQKKVEKPHEIRQGKKEIAQMLTIMREKQIAKQKSTL
jgi:ribosomal protein L29